MTLPLIVLAIGSIFAGWLGTPEYLWGSRWDHWLAGVFGAAPAHHGSVGTEIMITLITLAVVAVGIGLAYARYGRTDIKVGASVDSGSILYRLSLNKYYIDEIYDAVFVRPFTACSQFFAQIIDPSVIDGAVNGIAAATRGMSSIWVGLQTGNVQHYLAAFLVGTLALLAYCLGQL